MLEALTTASTVTTAFVAIMLFRLHRQSFKLKRQEFRANLLEERRELIKRFRPIWSTFFQHGKIDWTEWDQLKSILHEASLIFEPAVRQSIEEALWSADEAIRSEARIDNLGSSASDAQREELAEKYLQAKAKASNVIQPLLEQMIEATRISETDAGQSKLSLPWLPGFDKPKLTIANKNENL